MVAVGTNTFDEAIAANIAYNRLLRPATSYDGDSICAGAEEQGRFPGNGHAFAGFGEALDNANAPPAPLMTFASNVNVFAPQTACQAPGLPAYIPPPAYFNADLPASFTVEGQAGPEDLA